MVSIHYMSKYDHALIATRFEMLSIRYKCDNMETYYEPTFMIKSVKYKMENWVDLKSFF